MTTVNDNMEKNKEKKKKEMDREQYGFGYEKSIDDLKVLGQNDSAKNKNKNR